MDSCHLDMSRVRFLGVPKLRLSATHLVTLRLSNIPHSGYILTRDDGQCPFCIDKAQRIYTFILIASISPEPLHTRSFLTALESKSSVKWGVHYIFIRAIHSSDVSRPSKARRPVLNLGPFYELGFICLLRPRGIRVPVPWRLVITPRVSRHLAAAPQENYLVHGYVHPFSFRPPSTTIFRSRASTRETRLLRADKELSHRQGSSMRPSAE